MAPVLLDTNVLSELLRSVPTPEVLAFVDAQTNPLVSAAVFHELTYGVEMLPMGHRRARLSAGIQLFRRRFRDRTIAINAEIADVSGRLRAGAQRSGFSLKPLDALIAACAIAASARLATRNTKDFARLGIALVNPWAP
jgi:predicted nucleic acid-binding protein